jgi:hypothetical protein
LWQKKQGTDLFPEVVLRDDMAGHWVQTHRENGASQQIEQHLPAKKVVDSPVVKEHCKDVRMKPRNRKTTTHHKKCRDRSFTNEIIGVGNKKHPMLTVHSERESVGICHTNR